MSPVIAFHASGCAIAATGEAMARQAPASATAVRTSLGIDLMCSLQSCDRGCGRIDANRHRRRLQPLGRCRDPHAPAVARGFDDSQCAAKPQLPMIALEKLRAIETGIVDARERPLSAHVEA